MVEKGRLKTINGRMAKKLVFWKEFWSRCSRQTSFTVSSGSVLLCYSCPHTCYSCYSATTAFRKVLNLCLKCQLRVGLKENKSGEKKELSQPMWLPRRKRRAVSRRGMTRGSVEMSVTKLRGLLGQRMEDGKASAFHS